MNKKITIFVLFVISVIGVYFYIPNISAAPLNLVVQFQTQPLFNEANFAPGNTVTRFIQVTNNNATSKQVGVKGLNVIDNDALSSQINFVIKNGATTLYSGTLKGVFDAGELPLGAIAGNTTIQYDFFATFNPPAGNQYQGKQASFDFQIGFLGQAQAGGNIVIVKKTIGGNDTFGFTGNLGQFNITTVSGTGDKTFSNMSAGTYTVTEPSNVKGWTLTSVTCVDPSNNSNSNNRNAVIKLSAGETVTCTFTNTKR